MRIIREAFHIFVGITVNRLGPMLAGSRAGYAFLEKSVQRFHGADALVGILRSTRFRKVWYSRSLFGVVAIHVAVK